MAKRQKTEEQEAAEEEENVQPVVDPLENGFLHHAEREQERMNERLLKKTYSKKNKMVSVSASIVSSRDRAALLFLQASLEKEKTGEETPFAPHDSGGPIISQQSSIVNVSLHPCQT